MPFPFFTRPNFEDRQQVQYSGTSITLSGDTNIYQTGNLRIYKDALPGLVATSLDSNGTVVWGPISGVSWSVSACTSPLYVNNIVACPSTGGTIQVDAGNLALNSELNFLINLSAGTTTDNLLVIDSNGYVKNVPQSSITPIFTGGTGSCITDLYVTNIHGCSPLNIQPTSLDDVYMVMGGGNIGVGTLNPIQKLHISGSTRVEDEVNADVSLAVINNNNGGTSARGTIETRAIADVGGRTLSGVFTTSGYNTALSGFSDSGTGYLKNALTITVAGNVPRGDINIGTRDVNKFLRFFSGNQNFNSTYLRGSLNGVGAWGFGQNMTGQTATVHVKGYLGAHALKVDDSSDIPSLYVNDNGEVGVSVDPSYRFHVSGRTSNTELRYYDTTPLPSFDIVTNNDNDLTFLNVRDQTANSTIALTVRGINEPVYNGYGKPGDASLYASVNVNGLNIINHSGGGKEDYIRFYAGDDANTASNIHIQGSGTTKGYVGINNENPQERLDVIGKTKTTTLQVTSGATAGYVLTALDSNGNAYWAPVSGSTSTSGSGCTCTDFSATTIIAVAISAETGTVKDVIVESLSAQTIAVSGLTKTNTIQITSGATAGYILTSSDNNGNAVWQPADLISLGTGLTVHFSGKTIFNLPTSPAFGNISGDTTNAKFGMIQKIYHQDTVEPTFPATWNLVGEGVYFTNELNIIYAEYISNTWIEYWIIQLQ